MTSLWRIHAGRLEPVGAGRLDAERDLEAWIEADPKLLDPDLMIIGRQIDTVAGRLDLLGITGDGSLRIIELKRDKTPREVVAQILDYASWASKLTTPEIHQLAEEYARARRLQERFPDRFLQTFDRPLPDSLNGIHGMIIVASSLDPSSKRIVEYLNETHSVSINTAFFNVFEDGEARYLSADWLLDQQQVADRSDTKTKAPWTGYWYANVGDGAHRSWEDMRQYGFIAAGNGRFYSSRLSQLKTGELIYAYQKQSGYVGFGVVKGEVVPARDFQVHGTALADLPLKQPAIMHDHDDPELAEYVVPIEWRSTVPLGEARTFSGAFANQNVVCRLRDQATLEFLSRTFGK